MRLSDIHVPEAWEQAAAAALRAGGPTVVLGAVDVGKSTFARYLLGRAVAARGSAALLDGDVGMATVGTPAVLGLTMVADVNALDDRPAVDRSWFIGSTTPRGLLVPMLLGHAHLLGLAREAPFPLVVNSSGFIQGGAAKALHLGVIDLLRPTAVIGLQQGQECEHILTPVERRGVAVHRLQPSPRRRDKPAGYRAQIRTERFARYFEAAEKRTVTLSEFALEGTVLGSGHELDPTARAEVERELDAIVIEADAAGAGVGLVLGSPPHEEHAGQLQVALGRDGIHVIEAHETSGLLVGLLAGDGECLGLGLIDTWEGAGTLTIHTPFDGGRMDEVRRLTLGTVRLRRDGEEFGHWRRERALQAGPSELQPTDRPAAVAR